MSRLLDSMKLSVLEKNNYKCVDCGNTVGIHEISLHQTKDGLVAICHSCSGKRGFTK